MSTEQQYNAIGLQCRNIYERKLSDYGPSWRILRPESLTDQLFIKAQRIRTLETTGQSLVGEGIRPELIGLVNYSIIGLIQLARGYADQVDITPEQAMTDYDSHFRQAAELMARKNHDYGEAWRSMRPTSYTDLILTKLTRIKQIEDHEGKTEVSEGIDANYLDILNYAMFYLIRLMEADEEGAR